MENSVRLTYFGLSTVSNDKLQRKVINAQYESFHRTQYLVKKSTSIFWRKHAVEVMLGPLEYIHKKKIEQLLFHFSKTLTIRTLTTCYYKKWKNENRDKPWCGRLCHFAVFIKIV